MGAHALIPRWARHADGTPRRPTLLGRAIALVGAELLANAVCWIAAALTLRQADGLLGLALLAWTIGLRHGLDADHISAIDNATRQLVSLGQLPITCGLFFSLGHSTIVIVVNIAIAVSVDIYDKLDRFGSVGGIIGASVSASFLFLIACINIYFLVGAIKQRRRIKYRHAHNLPLEEDEDPTKIHGGGCLVRIIGPVLKAVDRPWKMYPVGVLFGLGFDTASSIALLAISAIAQRGPDGQAISHGKIVVLPFTAGMSLVDSLDSILMLYAYATPSTSTAEGKIALLQSYEPDLKRDEGDASDVRVMVTEDEDATALVPTLSSEPADTSRRGTSQDGVNSPRPALAGRSEIEMLEAEDQEHEAITKPLGNQRKGSAKTQHDNEQRSGDLSETTPGSATAAETTEAATTSAEEGLLREGGSSRQERILSVKTNTMSSLSIILTLLSILVALSISLITIMGLIGENCARCTEAAEDPNGGGLAGSWWRGWAKSGYEAKCSYEGDRS
ncbi:high-affinity nickel-transporter [Kwoniella heveanensis BCC8398]|uniref:High-affinity nickel-transporter n=1 Tax=Kwoniella heveanensis BCC8398 TaxID=1296120 RepID=A0A1B9GWG2_9TREE|nr:high-affinity nickel-transporter [Kwoniella heveanensis BCC8398]